MTIKSATSEVVVAPFQPQTRPKKNRLHVSKAHANSITTTHATAASTVAELQSIYIKKLTGCTMLPEG